jgi:hypothetical protein
VTTKRSFKEGEQIIIHTEGEICSSARDIAESTVFRGIVRLYVARLREQESPLLEHLGLSANGRSGAANSRADAESGLMRVLAALASSTLEETASALPHAERLLEPERRRALHEFVEGLYDFWRAFDRFMVLHSEPGPSSFERRPYRVFNQTIEALTHTVRSFYRDVCENITGNHPRIYRQVAAGCDVGLIAVPKECDLPPEYQECLGRVPFIRHVWIAPPMIIDPPTNTRHGRFQRVDHSPLHGLRLAEDEWLCYPACVGPLTINVYFHQSFIGLGCSLANLFELASDEQIAAGADAVFLFGVPPESMWQFGELPTVFYDDHANGQLVGAVPREDRFGYFGYLKKMMLTLHNIVMMKRGRMPFHGAMVHIALKNRRQANVLLIGDTAAGKSETLEAFRALGRERIRQMRVIADDMGSLEVRDDGTVRGFGTETGAFIRLDDLQPGYAFEQVDRAIIMSPQKVNARVVIPVNTLEDVLQGYPVDFLLYANNYEQVDDDHPILDRLDSAEQALRVFRDGAAMAKGTTTATGLGHSYFANIFGPPQYRELHEPLAQATFAAAFAGSVFVGQLRTRLGIPGYEASGPREAARVLLDLISA